MDISQIIEIIHSRSYEEQLKFQKQFIDEAKKSLKDKSIPDLTALLAHWRSEVKSHRHLDYPSQAKRWEAERWVEAIEDLLRQPASKSKPDTDNPNRSARDAKSMIKEYIEAVKKLNRGNLALSDLESSTSWSDTTWARTLKDEAFLLSLKKELMKRYDSKKFAPSEELKALYRSAMEHVDSKLEDKARDIMSSKSKRGKPRRDRNVDLDNYSSDAKENPHGYDLEDDDD